MITSRQAANGVREKLRPSQIAENNACKLEEAICAIGLAVMEGHIKRSDVLLCFSADQRLILESLPKSPSFPREKIRSLAPGLAEREVWLIWDILVSGATASDVYDSISVIEKHLHDKIQACLKKRFGRDEAGWWAKGVPLCVRSGCVLRREADGDYDQEAYAYTMLLDLKKIINKQWPLMVPILPNKVGNKKPELLRALDRLNGIRNRVMHPVRSEPPSLADYEFVQGLHRRLVVAPWRK